MPATDFSSASFGRSILGLRRENAAAVDPNLPSLATSSLSMPSTVNQYEIDLDAFQKNIVDRFANLPEPILTLDWIRSLLDAFICCHEEFRVILAKTRSMAQKPPLDRFVQDFFDRSIKALDVCNAIRDGIEQIREWKKLLEIVLVGLDDRSSGSRSRDNGTRAIGEWQFRRARKALVDLSILMLDEKDMSSSAATVTPHRNRSFGRHNSSTAAARSGHFRSLSWSVSRSWSAARQLQAIGSNLVPPKVNEITATGGVVTAVYAMGSVLLLVMWALVAAIPCQDRGLQIHFSVPKGLVWTGALMGIYEKLLDESRKKERRNACGLLSEIYKTERAVRVMAELIDSVQFPLSPEKEAEVREQVAELRQVYEWLNDGLDPLERQVRDAFRRIVISRTEGLDSLGRLGQ